MSIRILLADDHRMFREALRLALAVDPGLEVVAESGSGSATLAQLAALRPDLLLLDIALPDISGVEVARQALARAPGLRILALSGYTERVFVEEMLGAGASGYVVKSSGADELLRGIRSVMAGHVFLSPEVTQTLVPRAAPARSTTLGRREQEVLKLLADGLNSTAIGARLNISPETVKAHRRNIKHKLGLQSTAELTRHAIRIGLRAL
jgi:two-component system NarL family response regulator